MFVSAEGYIVRQIVSLIMMLAS